jgi:hypothetical protein
VDAVVMRHFQLGPGLRILFSVPMIAAAMVGQDSGINAG